jgi:two-component system cell cycle sensor histidine kinase/response regulator CckA
MASDNPFEMVILDLTVKDGMGGKDAIKKLMGVDPQVKAIVSSGYSVSPVMTGFRRFGFGWALPKPYTMQGLGDVLDQASRGQ